MNEAVQRAARARSEAGRARGDRPGQRRSLPARSSSASMSPRVQMEVRSSTDGTPQMFRGMASVTEQPYEMYDMFGSYEEVVSLGAFGPTLNRADLDVPLVIGHDTDRRLASTRNGSLTLTEITSGAQTGLECLAPPNLRNVFWQQVLPLLERGPNDEPALIDEMSFKFSITRGMWSPDYTQYRIDEVDLHRGDVSICGYGANPFTAGAGMQDEVEREPTTDPARAAHLDLLRREAARDLVRS